MTRAKGVGGCGKGRGQGPVSAASGSTWAVDLRTSTVLGVFPQSVLEPHCWSEPLRPLDSHRPICLGTATAVCDVGFGIRPSLLERRE